MDLVVQLFLFHFYCCQSYKMAISVCYWANYVNEKIKLCYCTCTAHQSYCSKREKKINLQNNTHNITSTTHPNLSFYLRETYRICNFLADYARKQYKAPISFSLEVYETSSKTGSRIRILYLLTRPIWLHTGDGRLPLPVPHFGTLYLTVSRTLILLCKPSNATLRLSFFATYQHIQRV